jgi:hypothetical protein
MVTDVHGRDHPAGTDLLAGALSALREAQLVNDLDDGAEVVRGLHRAVESVELAREINNVVFTLRAPSDGNQPVALSNAVHAAVQELRDVTVARQNSPIQLVHELDSATNQLDEKLRRVVDLNRNATDDPGRAKVFGALAERLDARLARSSAVAAAESAKRAAGITSDVRLADHFAQYARLERRAADRLRVASVVTVLTITAVATYIVLRASSQELSAGGASKFALSVPLAALAAYFARESARHRSSARWAGELTVLLLTIDAFTAPFSPPTREQVRLELAKRIFTAAGDAPGDTGQLASTLAESTALVESVTKLAKRPS